MNLACQAGCTATWTVTGNNLWNDQPASTFTSAVPLVVTNTGSAGTVTNLASTANQVMGTWSTTAWVTVPDGGTINLTARA